MLLTKVRPQVRETVPCRHSARCAEACVRRADRTLPRGRPHIPVGRLSRIGSGTAGRVLAGSGGAADGIPHGERRPGWLRRVSASGDPGDHLSPPLLCSQIRITVLSSG